MEYTVQKKKGVEPATQTGIGRGDPGASETLEVK